MVEFRYKDGNKEDRVLTCDVETCVEALKMWEQHLKDNNASGIQISHMEKPDKNWKDS